jgi:hypothetical protein
MRIGFSYYVADRLVPSRRRARAFDRSFDMSFSIDTAGVIPLGDLAIEGDNRAHGEAHEHIRRAVFDKAVDCLPPGLEDFVFVDLGSGKGRALLLAADYPFKRIVGIEFARELHEVATRNVVSYRSPTQRCTEFELRCQDAVDYELPPEKIVLYLYNPFGEVVLERVLENTRRSFEDRPRTIYVLYCNPEHLRSFSGIGFEEVKVRRDYAVFKACEVSADART